jgi:O-glycosyl hydrolase
VKQGLTLPIIAPETGGWDKFDSFASSLLADPMAAAYVGPIAIHSYSGIAHMLAIVQSSGHQVWQTEYTDLRDTSDPGMGSALTIATHIHADLVQGNVSAWHHWQFIAADPYPYSGLMDGKELNLLQDVSIANGTLPNTFTVWTTSDALALKQSGSLSVSSAGTFTATLPARSVTTLVSDQPGPMPSTSP